MHSETASFPYALLYPIEWIMYNSNAVNAHRLAFKNLAVAALLKQ
jgi:hypothetical protein